MIRREGGFSCQEPTGITSAGEERGRGRSEFLLDACPRTPPLALCSLRQAGLSLLALVVLAAHIPGEALGQTMAPTSAPVPVPGPSDALPTSLPSVIAGQFQPTDASESYWQLIELTEQRVFNSDEQSAIETLLASYTVRFATASADRVSTECNIGNQTLWTPYNSSSQVFVNQMEYMCVYSSNLLNVTTYPSLYLNYVNGNLSGMTSDLKALNLPVVAALQVRVLTGPPGAPPSPRPASSPSTTLADSITTESPTPDFSERNGTRTDPPTKVAASTVPVFAIIVIVVIGGILIMVVLVVFYRQRRRKREASGARPITATTRATPVRRASSRMKLFSNRSRKSQSDTEMGVVTGQSSRALRKSKVSEYKSKASEYRGDPSSVAASGVSIVDDELDHYKDRNIERLRTSVESDLPGFEGAMSAAVTGALMGNVRRDSSEARWGYDGEPTAAQVEASALWEVSDWLKRNDRAAAEAKRQFMQGILNKMVNSVRFGIIGADDAARAIHESGALLGLKLVNQLPTTTLIVSGMRKTVKFDHMVAAFSEFGPIDSAAIASGERGFGFVRFRNPKSAERALHRYRRAEIVVEDVAVQLKPIVPSAEGVSRA